LTHVRNPGRQWRRILSNDDASARAADASG
jgi:hypothetical protein